MPICANPRARTGEIQGLCEKEVQPNQKRPIGNSALSRQAKYKRPSGWVRSLGQNLRAAFSCQIEMAVPRMLPMAMAAKTAPFCSVVKLWRVLKTRGMTEKVM